MFSFLYDFFPIPTCVECFFFLSMVPIFQVVFYHILSMDPVWTVCKKGKHCVGILFLLVICHRNDIAQERNTKHLYLFYDISIIFLWYFFIFLYISFIFLCHLSPEWYCAGEKYQTFISFLWYFFIFLLYFFIFLWYFYEICLYFFIFLLFCHGNDIAEEKNTKHLYLFYTPYGFYLQFSSIQLQLLLDNDLLFEI